MSCSLYDPAFAPPPWETEGTTAVAVAAPGELDDPASIDGPEPSTEGGALVVPPIEPPIAVASEDQSVPENNGDAFSATPAPGAGEATRSLPERIPADPPSTALGDATESMDPGIEAPPHPARTTPTAPETAGGDTPESDPAKSAEGPIVAVAPVRIPLAPALPALPVSDILTPSQLRHETMLRLGPTIDAARDAAFLERLRQTPPTPRSTPGVPPPKPSPDRPSETAKAGSQPSGKRPAGTLDRSGFDAIGLGIGDPTTPFAIPGVTPVLDETPSLQFGTSLGPPMPTFDFGQQP